jgi:hypothetical protein
VTAPAAATPPATQTPEQRIALIAAAAALSADRPDGDLRRRQ